MALQSVERAAPRERRARLVVAPALVAVEPVARRVDVHRKRRVGRLDPLVVLLRDGLVGLAEVEDDRALRALLRGVGDAATVIAARAGDAVAPRGGGPGERARDAADGAG